MNSTGSEESLASPVKRRVSWSAISRRIKEISAKLVTLKTRQDVLDEENNNPLFRKLGAIDLMLFGIGAIIGTGIFVLTGIVAAKHAGPAVIISFLISGIVAAFAALCYSEMAAMIPVTGSAYTYAYATMGELVAWIIGWDLILEYMVAAAAVAVGWSSYVCAFFHDAFGVPIDARWVSSPVVFNTKTEKFETTGAFFNFPAAIISIFCTVILTIGVKESAHVNNVMVVVKVLVVILFIFFSIQYVDPANWVPFVPPNEGTFGHFGASGIFQGASIVFFAYVGFDSVSTAALECKKPARDLPIGIIGSLTVCTVLYIFVALVLTGMVPYAELDNAFPIAFALQKVGARWMAVIIEIGAIAGLTSVILITMLGQPRIFMSMARDGLLPPVFAKVHPRFGTPYVTTWIMGIICAIASGVLPVDVLSNLTSIGTLFAFLLVSLGVMILRLRHPDWERPFKVPFGPYVIPLLGATFNLLLIVTSAPSTIYRLLIWLAIGLIIYVSYGYKHSVVNHPKKSELLVEKEEEREDDEEPLEMETMNVAKV